jgi:hypothetical protein
VRRALLFVTLFAFLPLCAALGQTVPQGSQASQVQQAYRRTPSFRNDPFRHVSIPHWGLVFSAGGLAGNNSLNLSDIGAIRLLGDRDSLGVSEVLNMLGLIPAGSGVDAIAQGEGAVYLGGPIGAHIGIGLSARGTGYGAFHLDDNIVALLRDGNGGRQDFSLGTSKGSGLATAEAGAHMIVRLGPLGSPDGMKVNLGLGGRYLRPVAYAREQSTLANGGVLRLTGDSVVANIAIEQLLTRDPGETARRGGTNIAADFLLRLEWPTSGLAIEALVANVGTVSVPLVERSTFRLNVASTSLQAVQDSLDKDVNTAGFDFRPFVVQDTSTLKVALPRIVRFTASSWANRILQIDVGATMPVKGDFESPLAVDLGTTWRFIRSVPLRAGVILGGSHGIGYSGGIAIEGRTMYFQLAGQSLGGLFKKATGVGGRFELGLFF